MIGRLSGELVGHEDGQVIVDVHGVGYLVTVSRRTAERLPAAGGVTLQIHTQVREDALALFGFLDRSERAVFEALIEMTGVGPKAAIGILSGIAPEELIQAVVREDLARLCLIPGVGKKRAERMVLELKERLAPLAQAVVPGGDSQGDLRSALSNLGFTPGEIDAALAELRPQFAEGQGLEALLPQALRILRG